MKVSPEQLMGAARSIARSAEQFGTELQSLQATVTTDNPWGQDEPGTVFGMAYAAVLTHALETYGSHLDQLGFAAEGLAAWAQRVAATEHALEQRIGAIGTRAGT